MTDNSRQKNQLEEMQKRFEAELKKNPTVSDVEFMAEFEVSDAEYNRGMTLPAGETAEKEK